MKKLLCVLTAVLSLGFFSSCEKDSFHASDIVGVWGLSRVSLAVDNDDPVSQPVPEGSLFFEYNEDGTGKLWGTDLQETEFDYEVTGRRLVMDHAGDAITCTIESLTGDELSFTMHEDMTELTLWFDRI